MRFGSRNKGAIEPQNSISQGDWFAARSLDPYKVEMTSKPTENYKIAPVLYLPKLSRKVHPFILKVGPVDCRGPPIVVSQILRNHRREWFL